MKILVTGVAGFIGSHLAERLCSDLCEVVGVDNFDPYYSRATKIDNLTKLISEPRFRFREIDMNDREKLSGIFNVEMPDIVVHLAAKAGVRPSLENPYDYLECNVSNTLNLLEVMRKNNCKKCIFASSSSVYGTLNQIPFSEEASLYSAASLYATSKICGENLMNLYHNIYDFSVINLRFFTVYGPRQRPDLAISKFLRANLKNEQVTIYGDGKMARDYTYISDTISGIVAAVNRISRMAKLFETFNLGNSYPVSLLELIKEIERITGKEMLFKMEPVPLGDVPITFANIEKARRLLDYSPKVDLSSGLVFFLNWLQAQEQKTLRPGHV